MKAFRQKQPDLGLGGIRRGVRTDLGIFVSTVFWIFIFVWVGSQGDSLKVGYRFTGQQFDYYNLLVDNMLDGRLNLPVDQILSPEDRVKVASGQAVFILDSAYYNKQYYLFYGVVPAVLVLLPYSWLTGHDLGLSVACVLFISAGFLASVFWLRSVLYSVGVFGTRTAAFFVSMLAVLPMTLSVIRRSSFYDLPAAGGYAFVVTLMVSLYFAPRRDRWYAWLIAGLTFGLSVGCRSNLIFYGAAIPVVALVGRPGFRLYCKRIGMAALPALLVGSLLALYNYKRFGSILEFGFSYGMNSFFSTGNPLFSPSFVWPNLKWYFLTPPQLAPWFPFVFPISESELPLRYSNPEQMHGAIGVTAFVSLIGLGLLFFSKRISLQAVAGKVWLAIFAVLALVQLGFMLALGIRAYRYMPDTLAVMALLVVVAAIPLWKLERAAGFKSALVLVLAGAAGLSLLASLQLFRLFEYTRPRTFNAISGAVNPEFGTLEKFHNIPVGAGRMVVSFQKPESATYHSLVRTGLPHEFDEIRVAVHPGALVAFEIFHFGFGGPASALIPVEWGKKYTLEFTLGSLFPPKGDSYFRDKDAKSVQSIKSLGLVAFDGVAVIKKRMAFFESAPWIRDLQSPRSFLRDPRVVTIHEVGYGVKSALVEEHVDSLPISMFSLDAELSERMRGANSPILSMGITGAGTLLLLEPVGDNQWRVGIDIWGGGMVYGGKPFETPESRKGKFEIFIGVKGAKDPFPPELSNHLIVFLDGAVVGHFLLNHHNENLGIQGVGTNGPGFSSAAQGYLGEFKELRQSTEEKHVLLDKALRWVGKSPGEEGE